MNTDGSEGLNATIQTQRSEQVPKHASDILLTLYKSSHFKVLIV